RSTACGCSLTGSNERMIVGAITVLDDLPVLDAKDRCERHRRRDHVLAALHRERPIERSLEHRIGA
ncbi:MAG: hypothetical protein ACREXT_01245, partial [Gammaproteobacteria bacterium]